MDTHTFTLCGNNIPELVIKVLNENITTLEEIIELIETDQFFLTLEGC